MFNQNPMIFCLWLRGFLDSNKSETLSKEKLDEINNQLNDVITSIKEQKQQFPGNQFMPGFPIFNPNIGGQ